jgi:hypothetical protein
MENLQAPYVGCSILHIAVLSSCKEMVELLLNFGPDIYVRDEDGNTALSVAYALGLVDMINAITAYATKLFTSTPYSPCLSSFQSASSICNSDTNSLAVSSLTNSIIFIDGRQRGLSFSGVENLYRKQDSIALKSKSMSFSGHPSVIQSAPTQNFTGIAMNVPKQVETDVVLKTTTLSPLCEEIVVDRSEYPSHFPNTDIWSIHESVVTYSDGAEVDTTDSYVSDLTTEPGVKKTRSKQLSTKRIRRAASKVLNFMRLT